MHAAAACLPSDGNHRHARAADAPAAVEHARLPRRPLGDSLEREPSARRHHLGRLRAAGPRAAAGAGASQWHTGPRCSGAAARSSRGGHGVSRRRAPPARLGRRQRGAGQQPSATSTSPAVRHPVSRLSPPQAMLTGESAPQTKEDVQDAVDSGSGGGGGAGGERHLDAFLVEGSRGHSRHVVFGGTRVIQHFASDDAAAGPSACGLPVPPDGGATAVVLRTGVYSTQARREGAHAEGAPRVAPVVQGLSSSRRRLCAGRANAHHHAVHGPRDGGEPRGVLLHHGSPRLRRRVELLRHVQRRVCVGGGGGGEPAPLPSPPRPAACVQGGATPAATAGSSSCTAS